MTLKQLLERHTIFKCLLLVLGLGTGIAYVHDFLSPYMKIVLVLGYLIILGDLVRKKLELKDPAFWLLVAFAIGNCFTAYFNGGSYTARGIKDMAYMVMLFGLLFLKRKESDKELISKERLIIAKVALVALIAMCVANVVAGYLVPVGRSYETSDGVIGYLGIITGRLHGLCNTNVTGGISIGLVVISAAIVLYGIKDLWRVVSIIGIIVGTYTLILTKSRTAIIALLFLIIFVTLRSIVWKRLGEKIKRRIVIFVCCVAILFLAGFCIVLCISDSNEIFSIADQLLTGRVSIWKCGVDSFAEHIFFGTSPQYFSNVVLVEPYVYAKGGGIHSIYIGVLTYSGLFGVTMLSIFTVLYFKADYILSKSKTKISYGRYVCDAILIFFLLEGITECYFLYGFNFFAVAFWLIMGMRRDG